MEKLAPWLNTSALVEMPQSLPMMKHIIKAIVVTIITVIVNIIVAVAYATIVVFHYSGYLSPPLRPCFSASVPSE